MFPFEARCEVKSKLVIQLVAVLHHRPALQQVLVGARAAAQVELRPPLALDLEAPEAVVLRGVAVGGGRHRLVLLLRHGSEPRRGWVCESQGSLGATYSNRPTHANHVLTCCRQAQHHTGGASAAARLLHRPPHLLHPSLAPRRVKLCF